MQAASRRLCAISTSPFRSNRLILPSLITNQQSSVRNILQPSKTRRTMATSSPSQNEWLVILPDKPGAVERRLAVRGEHLKVANERAANGLINFGGVMLHEHIKEGETPKFKGSIMLFSVETKEEIWEMIKSDKYVENDVWDLEKVEIIPFKTALRRAL
ncbi:hypothetical protein TWF225_004006 [Orbilia oligospora]|uniref:Uncharacterized protein n=2 Tax=Orbilia oligospora TaxID=2813651 RepID=A0A7C8PVI0_ORBOL|nr:hypothetical protein TWF751_010240 [Orbilia oligospora]KAF3187769.1 hypothetical protein TWF225_004006 [Orbilia oligospora]KAF3248388.1 hypothetical protein TWF128_008378 [Orbilia oligospora]KAF3256907.1 hypothetical protein TWF217_006221 [Orbilia oligospora]KAF3294046.1 hypothetical protein TWF132_003920 [Orbilia oligospora]